MYMYISFIAVHGSLIVPDSLRGFLEFILFQNAVRVGMHVHVPLKR